MRIEHLSAMPEDWLQIADVYAALGDPVRQKILLLFEPGEELSIKDIVDVFPLSRTAIVHHLAVLERAGVLASRRAGKASLFSLRVPVVLQALDAVRQYIVEEFPAAAQEAL